MPRYVALLRAINLGAVRRVDMADLREVIEGLGFGEVATYLQSGNAVFTADLTNRGAVRAALEAAFEGRFGFEVPTVVRTADEMRRVVSECPYQLEAGSDPTRVHATFLDPTPSLEVWGAIPVAPEEFAVADGLLYMHLPHGMARARLPGLVERATRDVTATTRNWRTVLAVTRLADQST